MSPPPATASAEGAQLNGRPFPATASTEGRQFNGAPSLREGVRARGTLNHEPRVAYDASASVGSQTIYVASPHSHPRIRSCVGGVFRADSRTLSHHRLPAPPP